MPRNAALLTFVLALAACAPAPGPYPPPASRAAPTDALGREQVRLQRLAELRIREQQLRVERVGARLLEFVPDRPQIQFVIAAGDPSINAGATFGQVVVTSGILDFLRTDDELAMVLGHEIAHITEGHVTKGMIGNLALSVLAIVVETQAPGLGNTAGGIGQLFLNRYTQGQEREADTVGIGYAYQAGFDPRAAGDVQERLAVNVPQTMTAGFFDTHPSSVERMVAARKQAEDLWSGGPPPGRREVLAFEQEALERAERQRGRRAEAPAGDEAGPAYRSSTPRVARAAPEARGDEDCDRARSYVRRAGDSRDVGEREDLYRQALRYCPGLADAHAGLGLALRDRGERKESERELRRALELDPANPAAREALTAY